jgi:hypothetical protein
VELTVKKRRQYDLDRRGIDDPMARCLMPGQVICRGSSGFSRTSRCSAGECGRGMVLVCIRRHIDFKAER